MQVALTLDTATPQITGTVSGSQFDRPLIADLASNVLPSAEYTILFSPSDDVSAVSPPGDGYALVTNHAGVVTLSGALADGTRYNQTVPVSRAGDIPVFASLYTRTPAPTPACCWAGSILQTSRPPPPANALTWIKETAPLPPRFIPTALPTSCPPKAHSGPIRPAIPPAISLTNGELVISNTGLLLAFTNILVSDNKLT